jgi:3-hydroxymyristoyl/3-hydroxydecanoyl-(acyl carrier protein) dehydratase
VINPADQFNFEIPENVALGQPFDFAFSAKSEAAYFQGHFPEEPVLPAVAMIDACLLVIARLRPEPRLQKVISAKFLNKISPHQKVLIHVEPKEASWLFQWLDPSTRATLAQLELAIAV